MNQERESEIIFGIDPGTVVTGYGVIQIVEGKCVAMDYGCIRPPISLKLSDRYLIIFDSLVELLTRYRPKSFVVETQYVDRNVQSAIKLGMARGIALIAAKKQGVSVFEYAPTQAKLAVVGTGRASKQQVQGMVQHVLGLKSAPMPLDASDALALAICHAQSSEFRRKEM